MADGVFPIFGSLAAEISTWPPDMLDTFFPFYAEEFNDAVVLPTVREITGREPPTFEPWAKAHVDDFR